MNKLTEEQIYQLHSAWNYCDHEDKSTEFMFQYMSDMAGVEYDIAVDFVCNTPFEERKEYLNEIIKKDE